MNKITISVPATSANLGPGFDCFGIAYNLYNTFTFEKADEFELIGFDEGRVKGPHPTNENLCVKAFKAAAAACKQNAAGSKDLARSQNAACKITLDTCDVPICRGLGSSSTLIVAGVIAYNKLFDANFSDQKILEIATKVEGHPDNVAPALFGGLTCSAMDGETIALEKYTPSENLHFTVMIPDFKLSTKKARGVLPAEVKREDAIFNISHAVLIISALQSGDAEKISFALKDKIHQPYRKSLIPDYDAVCEKAKECGAAAVCLSGAGPTMLAISTSEIATKLKEKLTGLSANWQVLDLAVCQSGALK